MMKRTILLAAAATLIDLAAASTPASALEPGQCLPIAEMNAELRAAGQKILIIGNRIAFFDDAKAASGARIQKWLESFTSNSDWTLGFNLSGDKPMGQPSTKICIGAKLTNIRLFDARLPDARPGVTPNSQLADVLRKSEKIGNRPMLQADSISTAPDGTVRRGLSVMLQGKLDGVAPAWLMAIYPGEKSRDMLFMGDTEYTPTAIAWLEAQKGASPNPDRGH